MRGSRAPTTQAEEEIVCYTAEMLSDCCYHVIPLFTKSCFWDMQTITPLSSSRMLSHHVQPYHHTPVAWWPPPLLDSKDSCCCVPPQSFVLLAAVTSTFCGPVLHAFPFSASVKRSLWPLKPETSVSALATDIHYLMTPGTLNLFIQQRTPSRCVLPSLHFGIRQ